MRKIKHIFKYIYFFVIFCCVPCLYTKQKNTQNVIKYIIWDAGSTLTTIDQWGIAHEMGIKKIIQMLWYIGNQEKIRACMREVLEQYAGKQQAPCEADLLSNDDHGVPLPHFMSDTWLCSRVSNKELIQHINRAVDQWNPKQPFTKKQKNI